MYSMLRTLVGIVFAAITAHAQSSYGRVTGRVTDPSGAFVSGASIRAVQLATNIAATTSSNQDGVYELLNLLPGEYRITVELQGFKKHDRSPVPVSVGDVVGVDVQLEVGATSDSVTITAEAQLIESSSASVGQVINQKQLHELPLPGGAASYLMQLSPGVVSLNAPTHGWLPQARDSIANMSVGGSRNRNSEFQLDGAPNMAQSGNIAFSPPPEMIQEFRIQTQAYDASMGRFTGAQVNMVPKSGNNEWHGTGWFSHLSRPLMTHPFFVNKQLYDTRSGPPTADKRSSLWPATRTNRVRFSIAGPIIRNKTFFSYGNDFMERIFSGQGFNTVPTPDQRRGDFSALLRIGAAYQIYDPATTTPAANGRFQRQPIPGNILPASRLNQTAQTLLNFYPLPNNVGTVDFRNNHSTPPANTIDYRSHMGRVDHFVNQTWRFYLSLSASDVESGNPGPFRNEARGTYGGNEYRAAVFDNVITLGPSLVINWRAAVTRNKNWSFPNSTGYDLSKLNWPSSFTSQLDKRLTALPFVEIDGYAPLNDATPSEGGVVYPSTQGSIMHVRGTHTMRAGGEFRLLRESSYGYGNYTPNVGFAAAFTRGPLDTSPVAPIGQGLASFLLGVPTGGYIDRNANYAQQSTYQGWFFHDDWKATRTVTLNLGLRWEYEGPTTERFNRSNRGFDFGVTNPIEAQARAAYARAPIPQLTPDQFRTPGGLVFAGVNGQPRTQWNGRKKNFSPRIGIAWLARPKLSIRAGYGMFFESLGTDRNDVDQIGFDQRTSLVPTNDNGQTFIASLSNPFPSGFLEPLGAANGLRTFLGRSPGFFTPTRRQGYLQRWSLVVQRELPGRILIETGYAGSKGVGLGMGYDYDAIPVQYLSRSGERDQATIDFLGTNVTNPFRGMREFEGTAWFQNVNIARSQLLTPYPHFNGISTTVSDGFSWYHAGHVRMERRFARGFFMGATYTWSKYMEAVERLNAQDLYPHRVISPQDRPHHFVVNGQYEFPFARGKQSGWVRHVVGGWSTQAIYQWQSGPPIGFGNIIFRGKLADMVIPYGDRTPDRWFNIDAGFERDPAKALGSNYRTFPLRHTGLRADGFNTWDLSLFKNVRFADRLTLQLRAEAQDALNHTMFAAPNTGPVNTLFGTVNATIWSEQRKITVAAKLIW